MCGSLRNYINYLVYVLIIYLIFKSYTLNTVMESCIFCDIVAGRSPTTKIEFETDDIIIFKDIKPASIHHYLAVPKRHIDSLKVMGRGDIKLVNKLEDGLKELFNSKGINITMARFGFHFPPFISVKHLHLHGIAPLTEMSWCSRLIFRPHSPWFKLVDEAKAYLQNKA